ncbi:uncharacterized protein LOC111022069 [Momordica charantia]|uniref:Uncharacterized protein LOC111022069 n=1 Tax=Momordica charantia TaxID=3673 RepID=A0A6J1DNQ2_MOMCH|nr:uncharacterized protein LOC111022069 [Momordica charantia]
MALGCSIRGFRSSIRAVLVIDGAHLKGKYKDISTCIWNRRQGNRRLTDLVLGADEELYWRVEGLVFVSDRHRTSNNSVTSIFPTAKHISCMHHMQMNLNDKFKIRSEGVEWLYLLAAKAFKKSTFRYYWNQLAGFPEVRKYLEELGFDKWSRAYQPGLRYNQMTTNIAKSMNAVLVHARYLPITALLEHCRVLLQRSFYERRMYASTRASILTDYAEEIVKGAVEQTRRHTIRPIDNYEYKVHDGSSKVRVNLNSKSCTCKQFDYYQIPCSHAVATAMHRNVSIYTLCSPKYKLEALLNAYAEPIYSLGDEKDWTLPDDFC